MGYAEEKAQVLGARALKWDLRGTVVSTLTISWGKNGAMNGQPEHSPSHKPQTFGGQCGLMK